MNSQLAHQMSAVLLHGLDADAQLGSGLLVQVSLRDEPQHIHLSRGQLSE